MFGEFITGITHVQYCDTVYRTGSLFDALVDILAICTGMCLSGCCVHP